MKLIPLQTNHPYLGNAIWLIAMPRIIRRRVDRMARKWHRSNTVLFLLYIVCKIYSKIINKNMQFAFLLF